MISTAIHFHGSVQSLNPRVKPTRYRHTARSTAPTNRVFSTKVHLYSPATGINIDFDSGYISSLSYIAAIPDQHQLTCAGTVTTTGYLNVVISSYSFPEVTLRVRVAAGSTAGHCGTRIRIAAANHKTISKHMRVTGHSHLVYFTKIIDHIGDPDALMTIVMTPGDTGVSAATSTILQFGTRAEGCRIEHNNTNDIQGNPPSSFNLRSLLIQNTAGSFKVMDPNEDPAFHSHVGTHGATAIYSESNILMVLYIENTHDAYSCAILSCGGSDS